MFICCTILTNTLHLIHLKVESACSLLECRLLGVKSASLLIETSHFSLGTRNIHTHDRIIFWLLELYQPNFAWWAFSRNFDLGPKDKLQHAITRATTNLWIFICCIYLGRDPTIANYRPNIQYPLQKLDWYWIYAFFLGCGCSNHRAISCFSGIELPSGELT